MFLHAGASAANFWHYYPAHSMSKLTTDKKKLAKNKLNTCKLASGKKLSRKNNNKTLGFFHESF
jgi:hypothetical protein